MSRAFGIVYAAAQLASAIAYSAAGPLVALTGPRTTFVIAGTGMLTGIAVLAPALSARSARSAQPGADASHEHA